MTEPMIEIWCSIVGEGEIFPVTTSPQHTIYDLKEQIKEIRTHALSNVDAADLTLWKVRMTTASDSTTNCYIMISM